MSIVAAAVAGGVMAVGSSVSSSRNATKAQNNQNTENERRAKEANYAREKEWALSNGMSLEDFENGTFDGARSAIQPFYNNKLEGGIAQNISDKYGSLQEAYNPEEMTQQMDGYRSSFADSEQGAVGAIRGIYDGSQLSESQRYLQDITNQRLQGQGQIDLARQGMGDARTGVGLARGEIGLARDGVGLARDGVGLARDGVGFAREGEIAARNGIADARLQGVNAQAQAMTVEAQRQVAEQGRRGYNNPGGVLNNSGAGQAGMLQALMGMYSGMAGRRADVNVLNQQDQVLNEQVRIRNAQDQVLNEQDQVLSAQDKITTAQEGVLTAKDAITTAGEGLQGARERAKIDELNETARFAAYESNLAERKNAGQITNTLNSLANNQTAGVNNYFLPENVTTAALSGGGYLKGQTARASQYNSPSFTAPVKKGFLEHANAGVQGGLSTYMLASALGGGGTTTVPGTGSGVSYNHVPANPNTFSGGSMVS